MHWGIEAARGRSQLKFVSFVTKDSLLAVIENDMLDA